MIIRSYANGFEVADYTQELMNIPNQWGLINSLGIFNNDGIASTTVTIEQIDKTLGLIGDRVRGERNNVSKDATRKIHTFAVPHFPLDDMILPSDIQNKRAFGSEDAESVAAVRLRKLERLRWSHAATLEFARSKAITTGDVYAPNGTVSYNVYTDFGITRKEVDFDIDTSTTDIVKKGEEVIAHIQDNALSGEISTRIIALCSPEFFSKLISHASVKNAYQYYSSSQEVLRRRVANGTGPREFEHGGITYIEYRGNYGGTQMIPANDAYFLPVGSMDTFETYFAPANKLDLANTIGQEAYFFEYRDPKGSKIEIESESNFINLVRRPAVVVRGYTG